MNEFYTRIPMRHHVTEMDHQEQEKRMGTMLDYLLEEDCDVEIDVWNCEDLVEQFEFEVVDRYLKSEGAIEDMRSGLPRSEIVEDLWEGFEQWADQKMKHDMDFYFSKMDEEEALYE